MVSAAFRIKFFSAPPAKASDLGIIEHNPAHGIKKPKGNARDRRL